MKRLCIYLLVCVMVFTLSGCKTKEVKKLEEQIIKWNEKTERVYSEYTENVRVAMDSEESFQLFINTDGEEINFPDSVVCVEDLQQNLTDLLSVLHDYSQDSFNAGEQPTVEYHYYLDTNTGTVYQELLLFLGVYGNLEILNTWSNSEMVDSVFNQMGV